MKRPSAPTPVPATGLTVEGVGRGVVFAHLLITPLAFSTATIDGFEFVKYLCLVLTALLLLILGALALPRLTTETLTRELRQPLFLAGLALVGSALLATIFSISPHTSLYGHYENFQGFTTIASFFVLFVAARWLLRTPEQMQTALLAVAIGTAGVCLYGMLQALGLDPMTWQRVSIVGSWQRPFATLGHANFLGAYLVLSFPVIIWIAKGSRLRRNACWFLGVAVVVLILLTLSRSAWLGLAAGSLIGLVGWRLARRGISHRRIALGLMGLVGISALVFAIVPDAMQRVQRFQDSAGRFIIWDAAWRMFLDRPWTGWGPDTFPQIFGRYGGTEYWKVAWNQTPGRAHNEALHLLAALGIPGLLAMAAAVVALLMALRTSWRQRADQRGLTIAIAAALMGYFITQMFGFTVIACGSLACVLIAIISRLGEEPRSGTRQSSVSERNSGEFRYRMVLQAVIVAGCLFLIVQLVIDPLRADVRSRDAEQIAQDNPARALRLNEEAVRICPHEAMYWSRLALCAEQRSQVDSENRIALLEKAKTGYEEACRRNREDGFFKACVARVLGDRATIGLATRKEAYAAFDEALRSDPANANTYVDACRAALALGDLPAMKRYADAVVSLYPNVGLIQEQRAIYYLAQNRPDEALLIYRLAAQADWSNHPAEYVRFRFVLSELERRIEEMKKVNPPSETTTNPTLSRR